jgi:hypothetical protein
MGMPPKGMGKPNGKGAYGIANGKGTAMANGAPPPLKYAPPGYGWWW